ncbi:hypothetical protein BV22DRAFT_1024671 [Leucogyrophana mollusca]|uniref:Uncharacterized protein n=1 Tax=Leucogyrophana mollusca TaxID=85980 RepID=A0ACB8AXY1_9AGAM|nr:hypothetical protein BV22DRAFT_1024671 [Leucogyrophana mollusca]
MAGEREIVKVFSGEGGNDENPSNFLRQFSRHMLTASITDDAVIARNFINYLDAGSTADAWFADLPAATRASWALIETEFNKRWPSPVQIKKTSAEMQKEICDYQLTEEELEKTVKIGGKDTHAHVAWATKVLSMAQKAKIDQTDIIIWQVRRNLPLVIRDLIATEFATWDDFIKEVRDLKMERIREGLEKERRRNGDILKRLQEIEGRFPVSSQSTGLTPQLRRTFVTPAVQANAAQAARVDPPPRAPANPNPFNVGAGGQGNLRFTRQPATAQAPQTREPPTQAQKDALRRRIDEMPHHPDDAAGRAAYAIQLRDWQTTYGNTRVTENTPFPLLPGTAMICSEECFTCGCHGHKSRQCTAPENARISRNEGTWRSICTRTLGPINQGRAVAINLVIEEYEDSQGNGVGL